MNAIDAILRQLDDAWSHKWESVIAVLDGVSEAESAWQAPIYADVEREAGWPRGGSIHWQVAHLAHCKRDYVTHVRYRGRAKQRPQTEAAPEASYAAEVTALERAHVALRAAVAELLPADLTLEAGNTMALSEFLPMIIRHDSWHAGQIAVARRLYQMRPE